MDIFSLFRKPFCFKSKGKKCNFENGLKRIEEYFSVMKNIYVKKDEKESIKFLNKVMLYTYFYINNQN